MTFNLRPPLIYIIAHLLIISYTVVLYFYYDKI